MKLIYYISLVIGVLLLNSCAQISAPTGGEVDGYAPKLDSAGTVPLNYSTNFSGSQIVLTFNEYFVLKNPTTNVFFSPSIENEAEFITKGKTLTILLNNKLKENTTYTINFGDAISDYTVGNKIPDFKYVFSTGSFIDSMSTRGKVIDAYSGKGQEDILVLLYEDFSDSIVSKSKPVYYTKTDKEGNYKMSYIKAGYYKIMALKDENRNFLYDLPNEKIGYEDSLVNLSADSIKSNLLISVFAKDYQKQRVTTKKYQYPGKLTLGFLKSTDSIQLLDEQLAPVSYDFMELSKDRDSLILWNPNIGNIKAKLTVKLDTTTEVINIYPFAVPKENPGLKSIKVFRSFDKSEPFTIEFDVPISSINDSLIKLIFDSTEVKIDSITSDQRNLQVHFNKKEDASYKYQLLPNSVIDLFGNPNKDTLRGYVSVRKSDFYGSFILKLKAETDSSVYLVTLLDEKGKLLLTKKVRGSEKITFDKLEPGKYNIKAVEDGNGNGKWDTGNYYKKLKPESVFYFPVQIEVRSNWEVAESWEL